ncbi:hypothetical protein FGG30_gp085 [Mycobacterium phage Pixie]|uniref:Uncharacterized protein n=2 Tax=Keshuvirus pixie TaxID=1034114 RepID=G1D4Z4_9CAUD|nr:hypothetical protein FGG30_gp085 [Mycobacterium phage Pixie]AEK09895.1 hypothetical protein PBI_PIXIE_85 [Mycobacterium phage Pixie]AOT23821.1 hypothetical protein SEA_TBOND007_82 [Mycobacterium phage TBond007]
MTDRKGHSIASVEIDGVLYTDEWPLQAQRRDPLQTLQFSIDRALGQLAPLLGINLTPAQPTLREAAEDLLDAARVFLRVLFLAIVACFDRLGAAVAGRWRVLRARRWGRTRGPLIRLWDAEYNLVQIIPAGRPESWRAWLRRTAAFVWAVVRNGA